MDDLPPGFIPEDQAPSDAPPGFVPDAPAAQPPPMLARAPAPIEDVPPDPEPPTDEGLGPSTRTNLQGYQVGLENDAQRIKALAEGLQVTTQDGIDKHASILRLARETGVTFSTAAANYDALLENYKFAQSNPRQWVQTNPQLSDLILHNPELGVVVWRDPGLSKVAKGINKALGFLFEPFGPTDTPEQQAYMEKLKAQQQELLIKPTGPQGFKQDAQSEFVTKSDSWITRGIVPFARGKEMAAALNSDLLWTEIMMKGGPGAKGTAQLEQLAHEYELLGQKKDYQEGPLGQFASDVATGMVSSYVGMKDTAKGAGAGALTLGTLGAIGGGTGGFLEAGPAGIAPGAAEGFNLVVGEGAALGFKGAAFFGTWKLETGSTFKEMLRAKTDDGKPISNEVATGAAVIAGTLKAGIEVASLAPILKALGPAGELLRTGSRKAAVAALLKNGAFMDAAKRLGKHWAEATGAEMGEEVMQALTDDGIQYLGRSLQAGKLQKGPVFNLSSALHQGLEAGPAAFVMGGGAIGLNVVQSQIFAGKAKTSADVMRELGGLSDSPTATSHPEAVAESLRGGGLGANVYTDPHAAVKFWQAKKVDLDKAATELLGPDGPQQLKEALAGNTRLAIPTSTFIDKLSGTEAGLALSEHSSTDPALPTGYALDEFDAKVKDLRTRIEAGDYVAPEPETAGEASFVDAAERELEHVVGDPLKARQKMELMRAVVRQFSDTFGKSADELFRSFALRVKAGANPTMQEVLEQRAGLASLNRGEELLRDEPSGLPNELAFERTRPPAGKPLVGHLSVEGFKWLNDNLDHEKADLLGRAVGLALHGVTRPFKVGGSDFVFHVADQAELDRVTELVRQAMPPQLRGFAITSALGKDKGEAGTANQSKIDAAVAEGKRANPRPKDLAGDKLPSERPRGLPAGLEAKNIVFPEAKAPAALPLEAVEAVTKLTPEDFFKTAYRDPVFGTWTARAWRAMRRKAHVAAFDAAGLGDLNAAWGKAAGNELLARVKRYAMEIGGSRFDFTHMHGDEFAAQHDDLEALEGFADLLKARLSANPIALPADPETGDLQKHVIQLHHGFGDASLEAADHDLNRRKEQRAKADKAGLVRGGRGRARSGGARGSEAGRGARGDGGPGGQQGEEPGLVRRAAPGSVEEKLAYLEEKYSNARAPANKAAWKQLLDWTEGGMKGEFPAETPWAIESAAAAAVGLVDPKGFAGGEAGKDLRRPGYTKRRGGTKDGVGLVGNARDAYDNRKTVPMSRAFFQPAGEETLGYEFGSPAEQLEARRADPQRFESGPKEEGGDPRGSTEIFNEGLNRIYEVALNQNADLSTFLHESAHVFLDMMSKLALRPDAPTRLQSDYARTLKYLGAKNAADLQLGKGDETDPARARHEKWAEAFERYLFEGKAPSDNLEGAFARYREWMGKVYGRLGTNVPGAHINAEIRQVFDRLLATDQEIASRQQRQGNVAPMARELLGMDPKKFAEHIEHWKRATSVTRKRETLAVMKDVLREKTAWWKEELSGEREKARADYEALPERQLDQAIDRKGHVKVGPLDSAKVKAVLGEDAKKLGKERMKRGGADPEAVAEFFGFPNVETMLKALVALEPKSAWVEKTADQRMAAKHPELLADMQKFQERIDAGLHGDVDAQFLGRELVALAVKASVPGQPLHSSQVAPIETAKAAAKQMVEGRSVRRLDAAAALAAERRAATEALKAAAKGNASMAFAHYLQRVTHFYAWRLLLEAREMRDGFLQLAGELSKDKARGRLGKASPVLRDETDAAISELGLAEPTHDAPFQPDAIVREFERLTEEGKTVVVGFDPQRIEEIFAKVARYGRGRPKGLQYSVLNVAELRDVKDMLEGIKAAARAVTTVVVDGKRIELEDQVELNLAAAGRHLPPLPPPTERGAASVPRALGGVWNAVDGSQLKIETMLMWLADGNLEDPLWRSLGQPLQDAKHRETALINGPVKHLVDTSEKMPWAVAKRSNERIDGKALFPVFTEARERPERRWQFIEMLKHMGNESNKQRLLEGFNIGEKEVWDAAVKLGITKEEYDYVQATWDSAEALKKEAFDLEERDTGIRPEEITAVPISTPYGQYRGGYHPAAYMPTTKTGQRQALTPEGYKAMGTNRGYLKSRAENFSDVLSLDPGIIMKHIAQVAHDIAFREPLRSVGLLVRDEQMQQALVTRLGAERAKLFLDYLQDVGQQRGTEGTQWAVTAMSALRGMMSTNVLGFSGPNMLEDAVTGILGAMPGAKLKPQHLAAAVWAINDDLTAAAEAEQDAGRIRGKPGQGELLSRHKNLSRELMSNLSKMTSRLPPIGRAATAFVKDNAFVMQEVVDRLVSATIYIAAKRQALEGTDLPTQAQQLRAVEQAEAAVRLLMPSGHVVDSSKIMRDRGVLSAMLVFFRFWNTAYNVTRTRTGRDVLAGKSPKAIATMGGLVLGYAFAYSILGSLARGQGKDKDESWPAWFGRKMVTGIASQVPLLGELSEAVWWAAVGGKKREPRNNSISGMVQSIFTLLQRATSGDAEADQQVRALIGAGGLSTGLPTAQFLKSIGYLIDVHEGRVNPRGPFDVAGGLFYGQNVNSPSANPGTMTQDLVSGERIGAGPY